MIESFFNFIVSLGSEPLFTPEYLAFFRGLLFFSFGLSSLIFISRFVFSYRSSF